MPQNDSVEKTSKNYLEDTGRAAAPMLQDQHQKMKKNRRQQQPCLLQSPSPKMRIKKQKAGLARHKRRPQMKALLFLRAALPRNKTKTHKAHEQK